MEYMTRFFTTAGLLCFCLATGVSTADTSYVVPNSSHVGSNQSPSNEIKIVDENTHGWKKGDNKTSVRVVKRYLRWNSNQILPTSGEAFTVKYFKPDERSERVNKNGNYTGFTIYRRNGEEVKNTGMFFHVKTEDAYNNMKICLGRSLHAGAYYHIYENCPERDYGLIVSGHCYLQGRLFVNSFTFNKIQSYSDSRYYDSKNNGNNMNNIEKSHFEQCLTEWENSGYSPKYRCKVSGSFEVVNVVQAERNASTNNENLSTCLSCEDDCDLGRSHQIISSLILVITSSIIASSI
ncbi:hypothetical protein BSL78_29077 [Apostichopus japonicus]|uniref:Uncharacterized protein n=1 Tax=Stichopus japonicus TaxID=307972 RepID=A0A2G8JEC2_STIJA|nr:hypothetical protein BSL78_29077 [Apostichopus japonicus]